MIGSWELPGITAVESVEERRVAVLAVPGLLGDLQQDLGTNSLVVRIRGSLHGDAARDEFLEKLREPFRAGEPVPFVADILTATELEEVVILDLVVRETNDNADSFAYEITLREYVEPPEPPGFDTDLGLDVGLDVELDLLADLGLDMLELPDLLIPIPDIANPVEPIMPALAPVREAVAGLPDQLAELAKPLTG